MKKVKSKLFKSLALATTIFSIASCSQNLNCAGNYTSTTPYATESELKNYADSGFVNYKISRVFAESTVQEFSEQDWSGATVSEFPVVIFSTRTGEPRFYEFRVIKNGKEIGAVACVANKKEGTPVRYVMPYTLDIDTEVARAVSTNDCKFVDISYPSKLVVRNNYTGRAALAVDDTEISDTDDYEMTVTEILENADEDFLKEFGLDNEETVNQLIAEQKEEEQRIAEVWNEIDKAVELENTVTEEQAAEMAIEDEEDEVEARGLSIKTSTSKFQLDRWNNVSTWENCGGYCGPNVVSFIILGLGTDSGYEGIPTDSNDLTAISELYNKVEKYIGSGPKVFDDLDKGLRHFSKYKIVTDVGHSYWIIKDRMKSKKLPAISLRSSKSLTSSGIQWHYRTVIGTKTNTTTAKLKIFGRTIFKISFDDNFYLMHDNGTDGNPKGTFYENYIKLYHFWSAHVEKK